MRLGNWATHNCFLQFLPRPQGHERAQRKPTTEDAWNETARRWVWHTITNRWQWKTWQPSFSDTHQLWGPWFQITQLWFSRKWQLRNIMSFLKGEHGDVISFYFHNVSHIDFPYIISAKIIKEKLHPYLTADIPVRGSWNWWGDLAVYIPPSSQGPLNFKSFNVIRFQLTNLLNWKNPHEVFVIIVAVVGCVMVEPLQLNDLASRQCFGHMPRCYIQVDCQGSWVFDSWTSENAIKLW